MPATHMVSAASGIDWSDKARMHLVVRTGRSEIYVPAFAQDTKQLQQSCLLGAWVLVSHHGNMPKLDWTAIDKELTLAILKSSPLSGLWNKQSRIELQRLIAHRCPSYLSLVLGICWFAWRLRWPWRDIAEHFEISTHRVRHISYNVVRAAERLGYATWSWRKPYAPVGRQWSAERRAAKSAAMKRHYKNPACRKMTAVATRAAMARQEIRSKLKGQHWSPERRAAKSTALRAYYSNPAARKKTSVATRAAMARLTAKG